MNIKVVIKLAVTAIMLCLLFYMVDFSNLKDTLLSIPLWTALVVIFGYILGQIISAYKWWVIGQAGKIDVSFRVALKSYFIGMFVNCFGFGIVGGDVARGVLLANGKGLKTAAIASVVADRAHGLAVLALLGTVATALLGSQTLSAHFVYLLYIIGFSIVLGWYLGPKILLRIVPETNKLRKKAEEVSKVFPKNYSTVLLITCISVFFHLIQISLHWVMGQGFGIEIPLAYLLVAIPFVNILSSLPISWNGLGVRENAYIFFLAPQILSQEQAVAMGAIWLLAVTISSALGGIIAFATNDWALLSSEAKDFSRATV